MACPQCHRSVVYDTRNPWRPFCSERCKQVDFGAWANEEFRMAQTPDSEDADTGIANEAP
jgi:endogenous inhibitor of DNA gyrase (YacG/DUF329 family)